MRSWFTLSLLDLNSGLKSFVTCKAVNIAPVLAGCFHIDNRGYGHPVGLLRIVEIDRRIVNLAVHALQAKIGEAGIHGSDQLDYGAGLRLDPDRPRKWDGIISASKLHGCGRRCSRHGTEMDANVGDAIHRLVTLRL